MKYISFAIPCYNSAAYMDRAVESILKGGEDVEIIIVNDGSKDDTSKIAHEYEEKYPTIVRAVDKENGGHGDAVNAGLDHAEGKYFKVVDSDDWAGGEWLSLGRDGQVFGPPPPFPGFVLRPSGLPFLRRAGAPVPAGEGSSAEEFLWNFPPRTESSL